MWSLMYMAISLSAFLPFYDAAQGILTWGQQVGMLNGELSESKMLT